LVKGDGLKYQRAPDGTYKITQTVRGRVLLSNYDPRTLTDAERHRLNELAEENPVNFVMIDLRPGYPGGDFPMFGAFKLRSLIAVLGFIGEGIDSTPEFNVAKDPRTRGEVVSPTRTLAVHVTGGRRQRVCRQSSEAIIMGRRYEVGPGSFPAQLISVPSANPRT
jgi:hypothetical protein